MDSNVTGIIDVKTVLEEVECTQKVNGEMCSLDVNGESSTKRKRRIKKKKKLVVGLRDAPSSEGLPVQSHVYGGQQMDMDIARFRFENLTMRDEGITFRTHFTKSRKRLLVLDVNGLLVDIVHPPPKDCKLDTKILKRAIFKRPFLDEFLEFCFDRFDVAIWSSRTRKILDPVVDYLLGNSKKKLLFLWIIRTYPTAPIQVPGALKTGISSLSSNISGRYGKNMVLFLLPRMDIMMNQIMLLDDSPYKALLNPKHSGIFPLSYCYKDINDKSLGSQWRYVVQSASYGPNGDLRVYLEGLATTDDVKMYVEQHPFGQRAIDETSPHWTFYSKILKDAS